MEIISVLNWRYATKRMNGTKVPAEKMEVLLSAIALAPSSFGLQPYTILVIENKELLQKIQPVADKQPQIVECSALLVFAAWEKITEDKIDMYIRKIADVRGVETKSLAGVKAAIGVLLTKTDSENLIWSSKQAYIALGIALATAAAEEIDSTPMEGFDKIQLDELLELKSKGLCSQVLMAVGYRDADKDKLAHQKKVRRDKDDLFIYLP